MTVLTDALQRQLVNHQLDTKLVSLVDNRAYTGRQMAEMVNGLAEKFTQHGIKQGDVVLIALTNHWTYPLIEMALWQLDAIAHPIAPSSGMAEIQDEFEEYHYAAGIFDTAYTDSLEQAANFIPEPFLMDGAEINFYRYHTVQENNAGNFKQTNLALILNTSGSTGKPKRVGLTHEQLYHSAKHIAASQSLTDQDAALVVMPIFHVNAQVIQLLGTLISGGKLVVAQKFSASRFWSAIAHHEITWVSIVPTIIQILQMNEKAKSAFKHYQHDIKLKYVRSASFSLLPDQLTAFEKQYHLPIIEGYGMTEAASLIALNPFDAPKAGTVGLPIATDVALLIDGKISKKAGQSGEILLRGDHVITDYLDSRSDSFYNGWLLTGDLGQFDTDGYLKIVGRIKEIISHGGEKVAPLAIESVLRQLDFIDEVVVIGVPNTLYGEEVVAAVIANDSVNGLTETQMRERILQYAADNLSLPARPTRIVFVTDYPHNPTGKVMRHKLIAQLSQ